MTTVKFRLHCSLEVTKPEPHPSGCAFKNHITHIKVWSKAKSNATAVILSIALTHRFIPIYNGRKKSQVGSCEKPFYLIFIVFVSLWVNTLTFGDGMQKYGCWLTSLTTVQGCTLPSVSTIWIRGYWMVRDVARNINNEWSCWMYTQNTAFHPVTHWIKSLLLSECLLLQF